MPEVMQLQETLIPDGNVIRWYFHPLDGIQGGPFSSSQSDQVHSLEPEARSVLSLTDGKHVGFVPHHTCTEIPRTLASIHTLRELRYSFHSTDWVLIISEKLARYDIDQIIQKSYGRCIQKGPEISHVYVYHSSARDMQMELVKPYTGWPTIDFKSNTLSSRARRAIAEAEADSSISNTDDFISARSVVTDTTFFTAPVPQGWSWRSQQNSIMAGKSEYAQLLRQFNLLPIDPATEQDWSGRGQHVEFTNSERGIVNNLLEVQDVLGRTATAAVESVKCRRVLLARKTIYCNRQFTKEQAITEVAHMSKLEHSHIVRVIGTYVLGRELSILMYPVADFNLEEFLEMIRARAARFRKKMLRLFSRPTSHEHDGSNSASPATKILGPDTKLRCMVDSTFYFYTCLSQALLYIHQRLVKHMDIKPRNILVRKVPYRKVSSYKVYIADFGIAKSYDHITAVDTDGRTMFTPKYAAPEVVLQDIRGFPADVFSLGCVFIEMHATLHNRVLDLHASKNYEARYEILNTIRKEEEDMYESLQSLLSNEHSTSPSYQANIEKVQPWLIDLSSVPSRSVVLSMISKNSADRPSMKDVAENFSWRWRTTCCNAVYEQLSASTSSQREHKDEEIGHTEEPSDVD